MSAENGQDMVEYALVAAMIGCACVATTQNFAHILLASYNSITVTFEQYA
jgi:Flp pilus assembly pilin Flp